MKNRKLELATFQDVEGALNHITREALVQGICMSMEFHLRMDMEYAEQKEDSGYVKSTFLHGRS